MVKISSRHIAALTAVIVLLAAGAFVGFRLFIDRIDRAIPQADLFGAPTASPSVGPLATSEAPQPTTPPAGADIKGPLNFLIVGEDTRESQPGSLPHADAVLIMHVNANLTKAYITSLPRDLLVNVPAFAPSRSGADYTKLTHSLTYGSRVPGTNQQNTRQGFGLVAQTVSAYTGIDHFDAGAMLTFNGMVRFIDVIGGIDMNVDYPVTSIHMGPNGLNAEMAGGPFQHYYVGMQHLVGWQALDYARQRYSLPRGAYDRERHQRQMVKAAITKIFGFELIKYPFVAPYVVQAVGQLLTLDLRGRMVHEYAYALRNLRPDGITLVGLPGGSVYSGSSYIGESLAPIQASYFASVRADTVDQFLAANPGLINDPR